MPRWRGLRQGRPALYLVYQYGDPEWPDETLTELAKADITEDGGQVREVLVVKRWRYSPQLPAASIAAGAVWRMEAVQGRDNLWFSGATCSHEAVDSIVNYNARLADVMAARIQGRRPPGPDLLRRLWYEW